MSGPPPAGYQIVLAGVAGFVHQESVREAMEAFQEGFRTLGFDVPIRVGECRAGPVPLVFGAQHLQRGASLPPGAIIYNSEQLVRGHPWASADYLARLSRHPVWDFSAGNARRLSEAGHGDVRHVPVAYAAGLGRIAPAEEDIDVLFFGIVNPRRRRALESIAATGLKVIVLNGVYGAARDEHIARAKVVVNIHVAGESLFESARVVYLLANRKAVVCESAGAHGVEADLRGGVIEARYDDLAEACLAAVRDERRRRSVADAGFGLVRGPRRQAAAILRRALTGPGVLDYFASG